MAGAKLALFFVYVWPEPRSSAAGVRTRELITILQRNGWRVSAVSPSGISAHRDELEALGVQTISCDPNDSAITDSALGALSPDLVIYDRFVMEEQFGWRTRALWPRAFHVVDTQDLHSLRRARERTGALRPSEEEMGEDLLRELASLHRAGAALVVSDYEEKLLLDLGFPASRLLCLPFSAAADRQAPGFDQRQGFCFLGNFRHAPNLDSVRWLLTEHWPLIRSRLPTAELNLYGAYPPAEISAHKGKNGVFARGPVLDHRAALRTHRVLLAPLRFGAGIKGKVLEAWGTGTPVVGSSLTFEGMGEAGITADSPDDFAQRAVELHESEPRWKTERETSTNNLRARFSPALVEKLFLEFLSSAPREVDLVGRMLRHHGTNASKYFSRWIEAKNR
ncbi:MAG: glycosyltransferase family 4 protein [Bdellovibrionota bacterium]